MEQSQKRRGLILFLILGFSFAFASAHARPRGVIQIDSPTKEKHEKKSDLIGLPQIKPLGLGDLAELLSPAAREEAQKFLQASAAYQAGQDQNVVKILNDVSKSRFLSSEISWLKARALYRADQADEALQCLGGVERPNTLLSWERYWLRLEILASQGDYNSVKSAVAQLSAKIQSDISVGAKAGYFLGKAAWVADLHQQALDAFQKVLVNSPGTSADDLIASFLRSQDMTIESVLGEPLLNLRAEKLIATGYAHRGRMIYEKLREEKGDSSYDERLAAALFRERSYTEATKIYRTLLSRKNGAERLSTLVSLATASSRSDQADAAITFSQQILSSYPGSAAAAAVRNKLPFLFFDAGRYAEAAQAFERDALSGNAAQKERARWYRFWSFYLTKQYDKAREEMSLWRGKDRDQFVKSTYWMARCSEKLGRKLQARVGYQRVIDRDGGGYYGLLAQQRLHSGGTLPKTLISQDLMSVSSGAVDKQVSEQSRRLASTNEDLLRAAVLYRAGFDGLAFNSTLKLSPGILTDQAAFLREAGNYHAAYANVGMARRGSVTGCDNDCANALSYPHAYGKYVLPAAQKYGVDPALVFGVMRQESAFKPVALSFAYAKGLMQIIPPTADEIASDLGLQNYLSDDYQDPRINVAFGVYYLSKLLHQFGGDPVLAIAAYNAGPNAVGRWNKHYGSLPRDEFVELIAYQETANYVRRVLFNMLTYKKLYE